MDNKRKVFLGGFKTTESKKKLERLLNSIGLTNFVILNPPKINSSKTATFMIIELADEISYQSILKLQNLEYENRLLHVKKYLTGNQLKKEKERTRHLRLFLNRIPRKWDHNDLLYFFSKKFGPVEEACVMTDSENGNSRGMGYIIFTKPEQAQIVLDLQKIYFENDKLSFIIAQQYGPGKRGSFERTRSDSSESSEIKEFFCDQANTIENQLKIDHMTNPAMKGYKKRAYRHHGENLRVEFAKEFKS